MLANKIFEPLDDILQAYEARLKPNHKTMIEWVEEYPNLVDQKRPLRLFSRLMEATQILLE